MICTQGQSIILITLSLCKDRNIAIYTFQTQLAHVCVMVWPQCKQCKDGEKICSRGEMDTPGKWHLAAFPPVLASAALHHPSTWGIRAEEGPPVPLCVCGYSTMAMLWIASCFALVVSALGEWRPIAVGFVLPVIKL